MEISEETMEKELLIEVKNMTKFFGPTQALKGVNLKFYRGEIRGLIGENGSGKSTVTSIIAGMQAASGGEIVAPKFWLGRKIFMARNGKLRAFFVHKNFRMQCFFPLQKIFIGFHGKINFSL